MSKDWLKEPEFTHAVDPTDGKPFWWLRNVLRGGKPMLRKTALAQHEATLRMVREAVRANGGIVDNAGDRDEG